MTYEEMMALYPPDLFLQHPQLFSGPPEVVQAVIFLFDLGLDIGQLLLLLREFPDAPGNQVFKFLGKGVPNLAVNELRHLV